jgi:hypothetical protein
VLKSDNCRWTSQAENNRNTSRIILTWELVDKIRSGEWSHLSDKEISNEIGVYVTTIKNVRTYRTWVK